MRLALAALFTLSFTQAVQAQNTETKKPFIASLVQEYAKLTPDDFLKKYDQNKDGFVGRDELPMLLARGFEKADGDSDGKLDRREVEQMLTYLRQMASSNPATPGTPPGKDAEFFVGMLLKKFDTNGDGKIAKSEAKDRIADGFAALDKNKDGFLDKSELAPVVEKLRAMGSGAGAFGPRPTIGPDFDALDKNADGRLSPSELLGTQWGTRFREIDVGNDGTIDRREFEAFLKKNAGQ